MTAKKRDEAKKEEGMLNPKSIEALRASNELLSLFMRHSPVYAYIKSVTPTESRIVQASDNYQRMLGSSSLDIVGKTMEDLFPAGFAAKMTADDWAVVVNGSVLQVEKDLDDRSYISIKFPFVHGDKNMLAGYMLDITERKQAEGSLEKRELLLKEAQEAAHTSNVAERKQAEEALREVEEKLRAGEEKLQAVEGKLRADREKLQSVEEKLREVEGKPQALEGKLREVEGKLRKEEEKLQGIEGKLRASEEKLQAGEGKLRADEEKLQAIDNKLRAGEEKLQAIDKKLRADEGKPREVEGKLQVGEKKLQEVEGKLRAGEEKLQALDKKLRAGEEKLQALEGKPREVETKLQEIEGKLRAGEKKLQEVEGKLRAGEKKLQEVEGKLRAGEEKLQAVEGKPREVEGKLREADEKLRKGEEKLKEVEGKLRAGEEKLQALDKKLREGEAAAAAFNKAAETKGKITAADAASLKGKELLLGEVHNDVRNNMYSIIALMEMQRKVQEKPVARLLGRPASADAGLEALESRIRSMALIHERLYQSHDPSHIDFQDYLDALVSHLRTSLDASPDIICSVNAAGIEFKLDTAVPVGMIVNELVTNTFKYAFPDNKPRSGADQCELKISLERKDADYTLIVEDNGVGLPEMDSLAKKPALGLRLVRMLGVDQLGGKLTLNRTKGTRFALRFNAAQ